MYLLQFNLFAPTSWPGGAALRCRSERGTAGRSPVLPEPGTAPQSHGCANTSHRPTQAYLRTGNFTVRPGRGSQAVCFVLYLLLQLGEPQRNTCYFFICNKNGNKLYFCSRIWAVCLSCCLLPVCGERWVARAWGHWDRETGHRGTGSFGADLWLLALAQRCQAPVETSTSCPCNVAQAPQGSGMSRGWGGGWVRLPGGGSFLPHPAAPLGQEPIPRKHQSLPAPARPSRGRMPRGATLAPAPCWDPQAAGVGASPPPWQHRASLCPAGSAGRANTGVMSAQGSAAAKPTRPWGWWQWGGWGVAIPFLLLPQGESAPELPRDMPGALLEPPRWDGTSSSEKGKVDGQTMCPSEVGRVRRPEPLPSPPSPAGPQPLPTPPRVFGHCGLAPCSQACTRPISSHWSRGCSLRPPASPHCAQHGHSGDGVKLWWVPGGPCSCFPPISQPWIGAGMRLEPHCHPPPRPGPSPPSCHGEATAHACLAAHPACSSSQESNQREQSLLPPPAYQSLQETPSPAPALSWKVKHWAPMPSAVLPPANIDRAGKAKSTRSWSLL